MKQASLLSGNAFALLDTDHFFIIAHSLKRKKKHDRTHRQNSSLQAVSFSPSWMVSANLSWRIFLLAIGQNVWIREQNVKQMFYL